MSAYERWIARHYLANVLRSRDFGQPPQSTADILQRIESHRCALGIAPLKLSDTHTSDSGVAREKARKAAWRSWRADAIVRLTAAAPEPSPLQRRINFVADACGLNPQRRFLFGLFVRFDRSEMVRNLGAAIMERLRCVTARQMFDLDEIALLCGQDIEEDDEESPLVTLGLLKRSSGGHVRLSDLLSRLMARRRLEACHLRQALLGRPRPAALAWDDFAHLGEPRDLAARIIAGAGTADGATGSAANILFYGPPGTGKSEFAKALGAHLGHQVRFVGETDDENAEPSRNERIAALMIANAIGAMTGLIIVVDEADDLFAGVDEDDASTRHGSKVFMNRLVERAKAPTIWITNDLHRLGSAVARRMNLVIRFPKPGLPVRLKMVERIARRAEFRLDATAAAKLARLPAAPALIENAIRSAARIAGSSVEALTILEGGLSATGVREATAAPAPMAFDPALSSADVDLAALADQVARSPSRALSFCLSCLPGTGKSAYARYLAERLELEVLEKRYSDLSSMYVGESEKTIARAFEEAADLRAFLILDEADSLLRDRALARQTWEVTQVNEILTWMERHPHPFA